MNKTDMTYTTPQSNQIHTFCSRKWRDQRNIKNLLKEIIAKKFPSLPWDLILDTRSSEISKHMQPKNLLSMAHYTYIVQKNKEKNRQIEWVREKEFLKKARENCLVTYKGTQFRLIVELSVKILQARREWNDIFKVPGEKKKKKPVSQEYYIQQSFTSETKEK